MCLCASPVIPPNESKWCHHTSEAVNKPFWTLLLTSHMFLPAIQTQACYCHLYLDNTFGYLILALLQQQRDLRTWAKTVCTVKAEWLHCGVDSEVPGWEILDQTPSCCCQGYIFYNVASFSSIIGLIYFIGQFNISLNSVQISAQTNKIHLLLLLPVPVQHQLDYQTSVKFMGDSTVLIKELVLC